ncbi:2OG-Fe(II) oxygenase [Neiella marina]|uniref:2-oxoglutarate-dependent ethylene/succinate-forming enzyme n=1 Tax=Neiella marina TaxID=508461 RepID=A0A8J2XP01_9GAMM|nr:2OG-Fe(II) oxygenase family protein [Neiella marina]GGA72849.1 2OG-Fe(II) oxygenase [Neiella marina]
MAIPTIDFSCFDSADPCCLEQLASQVDQALRNSGFMMITGLAIDERSQAQAFESAKQFFALPAVDKDNSRYTNSGDNFGYQQLQGEHLDPTAPADLKEAFTMRDAINQRNHWPNTEFRTSAQSFYQQCMFGAQQVLTVMALALELPGDFFNQRHLGENITLRYLHYPASLQPCSERQLGAGAHTDYGTITLLFQHGVSGLQVQDKQGNWLDVPCIDNAIVINTGDLMHRWSNGRYRSTLHRVKPASTERPRYAIAFFVDPDSDIAIECLPSCVSEQQPARFVPTTAGQHIQDKIQASLDAANAAKEYS